MSLEHFLVVLSAMISLSGAYAYIRGTLVGETKPNRVSWFMWALAPLVATFAALSAHADVWTTARIFLAGFVPLLVLIASFFNKKSYWKITFFDSICGAFSFIALIIWLFIDQPIIAILVAALGDGFAAIPTLAKAWKHPETETGLTFLAGLMATILVLPSIKVWNIQNSAFQIYLLVVNVFLLFFIYRKRFLFAEKK